MKKFLICFAAGCLGALASALVAWQCGKLGIPRWAGVLMTPSLTAGWLHPKIVYGGLWGLLFTLPFLRSEYLLKGSILSLIPSGVELLYIFPYHDHLGFAGTRLGDWAPVFVLVYNWVWGVATALTLKFSK